MRAQSVLLVTFVFAFFLVSSAAAQPAGIVLKVMSGKPVVDGVLLDGHGPYRFLLDTGSQSNQLDSSLAGKLGFAPTLQLELQTPSCGSTVRGGRVKTVNLGPAVASDQEFLFTSFDKLSTLAPEIRGILGQEFLAHFDYVLDFQHHRVTFGESSIPGVQTRFRLIFGRMAIPTSLGDLILDSGAEMLFLFRQSTHSANAQVIGASGARAAVSIATAPEVRIGDRRLRPANAEYRPVPVAEEAGLLPANLFHAIFICNSRQYVVFDPVP